MRSGLKNQNIFHYNRDINRGPLQPTLSLAVGQEENESVFHKTD